LHNTQSATQAANLHDTTSYDTQVPYAFFYDKTALGRLARIPILTRRAAKHCFHTLASCNQAMHYTLKNNVQPIGAASRQGTITKMAQLPTCCNRGSTQRPSPTKMNLHAMLLSSRGRRPRWSARRELCTAGCGGAIPRGRPQRNRFPGCGPTTLQTFHAHLLCVEGFQRT